MDTKTKNPWAKGGEHYPNWIDEDRQYWKDHADYVTGKRKFPATKIKNPVTKEILTIEELEVFKEFNIDVYQSSNPYDLLKKILEKIAGIRFPELPTDERIKAEWAKMFECWFFETIEEFDSCQWVNNSNTLFFPNSLYCEDIINSVSFSDISAKKNNSIKSKFFSIADNKRPNPFSTSFQFVGGGTGIENYYSYVEWFIGSYNANIYWKLTDDGYEIKSKISNTSSWYSGTRLPKSWQNKLKKVLGFEIKNLVDSAPRGETIKRKLNKTVIYTLESLGFVIPSFGGNWNQVFNIETKW